MKDMSEAEDAIGNAVLRRTLIVVLVFCAYAAAVAFVPTGTQGEPHAATAIDGPLAGASAWRKSGCHSCHSLYGLGGHTGPDLTNIVSRSSPEYIAAVVTNGLPGMPAYEKMRRDTLEQIVGYLASVDQTATYPPRSLSAGVFGDH